MMFRSSLPQVVCMRAHVVLCFLCISPGIPVSSTNKSERDDITEILLKVALNTITLTQCRKEVFPFIFCLLFWHKPSLVFTSKLTTVKDEWNSLYRP